MDCILKILAADDSYNHNFQIAYLRINVQLDTRRSSYIQRNAVKVGMNLLQ